MKHKNPFVDQSAFEGEDKPKPSEDEVLMAEAKQHTEVVEVKTHMITGMMVGLVLGLVVGSLLGAMSTGGGLGMLAGLVIGLCIHKKPKEENAEKMKNTTKEENTTQKE